MLASTKTRPEPHSQTSASSSEAVKKSGAKNYFQDLREKADVQAHPEKITLREEIGEYEAYNLTVEEAEEENPLVLSPKKAQRFSNHFMLNNMFVVC